MEGSSGNRKEKMQKHSFVDSSQKGQQNDKSTLIKEVIESREKEWNDKFFKCNGELVATKDELRKLKAERAELLETVKKLSSLPSSFNDSAMAKATEQDKNQIALSFDLLKMRAEQAESAANTFKSLVEELLVEGNTREFKDREGTNALKQVFLTNAVELKAEYAKQKQYLQSISDSISLEPLNYFSAQLSNSNQDWQKTFISRFTEASGCLEKLETQFKEMKQLATSLNSFDFSPVVNKLDEIYVNWNKEEKDKFGFFLI